MDPIATRVAARFVHKIAEERQKYPDGRLVPIEGDKVFQMVRGMFDTAAVIDGVVYKSRGGLRVKVTGGGGIIGQAPTGKTYKLSEYWTVRDDPQIKAREEERKRIQLEKETKAQRMREIEELAIAAKAKELGLRKVKGIHDVKVGEEVFSLAVLDHVEGEEPKVDVAKETVTGLGQSWFLYKSEAVGGHEVTSGKPEMWWRKASRQAGEGDHQAHANKPPKGFRENQETGELYCPHRDVSCCPTCAKGHPEIVEVGGQHFWTHSPQEKQELLRLQHKR